MFESIKNFFRKQQPQKKQTQQQKPAPVLSHECPDSHRLNRAENWLVGTHCSGVIQCSTCGKVTRYDRSFNVHHTNMIKKFSERVDGQWRQVESADDLVWEFEENA